MSPPADARQAASTLIGSTGVEPPPDSIVPGTVLDGRYRIERALGSGAMGIVVLARHLELDRSVAIKLLRPELAGYVGVAMRFRDEARATAAIRSEHAVRVYDVSPATVHPPFIVMERLRGSDLEALLQQGPFTVEEAVDYVLQACAGVAAAHALGIIHRDLKPANLFLARDEAGGQLVKVLDFGIAKSILEESKIHRMTASGETRGTPAYMSPDQLETPDDLDVTTDVWALGVILCELLTGELPFGAPNLARLSVAILTETPVRPSSLRAGVPPELDAIVARCLQKKRADRYPNVLALAEALAPLGTRGAERLVRVRAAMVPPAQGTEPPSDQVPPPGMAGAAPMPPPIVVERPWPDASFEEPVKTIPRQPVRAPILVGIGVLALAVVLGVIAMVRSRSSGGPTTSMAPPDLSAAVVAPSPTASATSSAVPTSTDAASASQGAPPSPAVVPSVRASHSPSLRPPPATGGRPKVSDEDREFGGRK